jgi:1,2-phenylacetyl-CoA epoxidase catalytic subunit
MQLEEEKIDARYVGTLVQLMESQAYRELAAARLFGFGLTLVPELRWLKFISFHIQEEIEHYDNVARMYRELTGESVEPAVNERLRRRPIAHPRSWYELGMAQFLYDRGGYWQLREYEECTYQPYRRVVVKILREEKGHQSLGERLVVELTRSGRFEDVKQACFDQWLHEGLLSFGRPDTEGSRYAISVGIKRRDPGRVMQDFLDDIKPAVKACKLAFPPLESIGIVGPATGLDLSLDGIDETKAEGYL